MYRTKAGAKALEGELEYVKIKLFEAITFKRNV